MMRIIIIIGPLEGHLLVIEKALCGLCTSGARFHAKFADTLRALGFTPTYADLNVWIRDAGDVYEYVVVYVDDILTALKDPDSFYKELQSDPWNYKLKNVEEPRFHLGGAFFRDKDGTLCWCPIQGKNFSSRLSKIRSPRQVK